MQIHTDKKWVKSRMCVQYNTANETKQLRKFVTTCNISLTFFWKSKHVKRFVCSRKLMLWFCVHGATWSMYELRTHTHTQTHYAILFALCLGTHWTYFYSEASMWKPILHSSSYDELFKNQIINAGEQASKQSSVSGKKHGKVCTLKFHFVDLLLHIDVIW